MALKWTILSATCGMLLAHGAAAQDWLRSVPAAKEAEMSVGDLRAAFDKYYQDHPIDLKQEQLKPTFRFRGEAEEKAKIGLESYKLFRRWEWLVEPRAYPNGRLDLEKIGTFRRAVAEADSALEAAVAAQPEAAGPEKEKKKAKPSWHSVGPADAVGGTNLGRVNCVEFDPKNLNVLYLCAADGGVWKSTDGGMSWKTHFDLEETLSSGDVAVSRQHPDTVYVATSDAFGYGAPFWGGTYSIGVVRSANGGVTWKHTNLKWTVAQNRTIRRLVIHPTDDKILLAATSDGVFRTANGGATWKRVITASAYDAEFDESNGSIAYVTTNQVLKSTNAGATFSALSANCAGSRYNLKIANSNPNVLYTLCTDGTVQKSVNAGASWTTAAPSGVSLYGYYDDVLAVSPTDDKTVFVAGFNIRKTTDGGATWTSVPTAGHVDNHTIKFKPGSNTEVYSGNDGGLFVSKDGGTTWSSLNKGLAITQFYGLGVARTNPSIIIAGAQDNGNMKSTSGTFTNITNADGMKCFVDWSNASVLYASIQNGSLYRSTDGGATFTDVSTPASGAWTTPWSQDASTANTIYAGTDKVYKSTTQGTSWTAISASLVPQFTVLRVASSDSKVVYAGSGTQLYHTTNGGSSWTNVTAGLPVATNYLTEVAIDDSNPNIAYATFSGYVNGEKLYRTKDGGATWTNDSAGLPNMPVDTIVAQKGASHAVYIGTDAGVYFKDDHVGHWIPYKHGLPNVIVDGLDIDYGTNTLTAATYGRGIWQAPLR